MTERNQEQIIADPSFDGTFKKIFTFENITNDITGNDRLKSLLNSLLYPDSAESNNDFMIREIKELPNEMTNISQTSLGILKSDIVCRCVCNSGNESKSKQVIFDIEMQTGFDFAFENRLFNYATALKQRNNGKPVIVLAFLNYTKNEQDYSAAFYKKTEDGKISYVPNNLDIYSIHLGNINKKLREKEEIKIADKKIGKIGKEWLSLLSIRHPERHSNALYSAPNVSDKFVKSAVTMLQNYKQHELAEHIRLESDAKGLLNSAKKDGLTEGEERGLVKGIAEGEKKKAIEMAKNLLLAGIDIKIISKASNLSISEVETLI